MLARVALALTILALAVPAVALGQASPFTPIPPAAPDTQAQTTTVPKTVNNGQDSGGGGLSGAGKAAIIAVGALLLGGVAWMIVRDARTAAPVAETEAGPKGTVSPQRHARARKKAKAARQQRKRNRARR